MLRRTFVASVTATGISLAAPTLTMARKGPIQPSEDIDMAQPAPQTGYVPVNGLEMYYEIHGIGQLCDRCRRRRWHWRTWSVRLSGRRASGNDVTSLLGAYSLSKSGT
jgi:hypothetical protein